MLRRCGQLSFNQTCFSVQIAGAKIILECHCHIREGLDEILVIRSNAILSTYDAMTKYSNITSARLAKNMPDGYARASGKIGVAVTTSGLRGDQHGRRHCYAHDGVLAHRYAYRLNRVEVDQNGSPFKERLYQCYIAQSRSAITSPLSPAISPESLRTPFEK